MSNESSASSRGLALLGCSTILGFAAAVTYGVYWAIDAFLHLDTKISAALIAGVFTILVSVFGNLGIKAFEKRKEVEAELREKKRPVYESFVRTVFEEFLYPGVRDGEVSEEAVQRLLAQNSTLLVWGSAGDDPAMGSIPHPGR